MRGRLDTPASDTGAAAQDPPLASHPERPDVFISYSRADAAFVAERLVPALRAHGKAVWVDLTDIPPAAAWRDRVWSAITATKAVLPVLSPSFLKSPTCAEEIERAVRAHKRLVPVRIQHVDASAVDPSLSSLNWILLGATDDFQAGIDRVIEALDTDLDWRDQHARLSVRAEEWTAGGGDNSRLLRGSDLKDAESWLGSQAAHAETATDQQTEFIIASRRASSRRLKQLLTATVFALALAIALTIFALIQRNTAIKRQHIAQSRALAASAVNQLPVDPQLSLLLAARAEHTADTLQGRNALRDALQRSRVQAIIRAPHGEGGEHTVAAFAPRSTTVAATFGHRVTIWDGRTGRQIAQLEHDGYPSFTADGRFLLTTFNDRHVWVYDTRDWKPLGSLPSDVAVSNVWSSRNGRWVIGVAGDNALVWDMHTRRVATRLPHPQRVESAALNPTSELALTAAADGIRVWRLSSGARIAKFGSVHPDDSPTGHFSASGKVVVTTGVQTEAGARGRVVFWRARDGAELADLPAGAFTGRAIASADGRRLVTSGFGSPPLVTPLSGDVPDAASVELSDTARAAGEAEFSPDGNLVVTAGSDGVAKVFDANSGRLEQSFAGHADALLHAEFSADGNSLLTVGKDSTVRTWNVGVRTFWAGGDLALDAHFSPNGRDVAATTGDGLAHVWEARSGRLQLQFRLSDSTEPETDGRIAFTPDGSTLVTESSAIDRRRVDLRRKVWIARGEEASFDEAPSPDGRLVAVAPDEIPGDAVIQQLAGGRRVGSVPVPEGGQVMGFAVDNRVVLIHTLRDLELWDWQAHRRIAALPTPATWDAVDLDSRGRLAATGENTGKVVLWDLSHGTPRRVRAFAAATPYALSVDISPDRRLVAAGYESGKVAVWDRTTGESVATFTTPARVTKVEFSPDSSSILTASGATSSGTSGTVSAYACDACRDHQGMLSLAAARSTRRLTAAELSRFGA